MQLRADDLYGYNGYSYVYLHPGYCGPIYVNQVWSEDVSAGAYVDKYWDNGCVAYGPKRMIKAEIECESPEILNSILGQIANMVACPFDDPVKENKTDYITGLTYIGCFNDDFPSDGKNGQLCIVNNKMFVYCNGWDLVTECVEKIDKIEKYKLKHKVLYKC